MGRVEPNRGSQSSPESGHPPTLPDWDFERVGKDRLWPGQAKAEFNLTAVNQSSKADRREKSWADHQGPVVAERRHH